jgi:prepilin-type processing-associated H-X9-DG protein
MQKTASVAEFTKQSGPITNALAPGESVLVTSYGKAKLLFADGHVESGRQTNWVAATETARRWPVRRLQQRRNVWEKGVEA